MGLVWRVDRVLAWVEANRLDGEWADGSDPEELRRLLVELRSLFEPLDELMGGSDAPAPEPEPEAEPEPLDPLGESPVLPLNEPLPRMMNLRGETIGVGDRIVVGQSSYEVIALGEGRLYYQGDGPITSVALDTSVRAPDAPTLKDELRSILFDFAADGGRADDERLLGYVQRLEPWGVWDERLEN